MSTIVLKFKYHAAAYYHKTQIKFKVGWCYFYCFWFMSLYNLICKLGIIYVPWTHSRIIYKNISVKKLLWFINIQLRSIPSKLTWFTGKALWKWGYHLWRKFQNFALHSSKIENPKFPSLCLMYVFFGTDLNLWNHK